MDIIRVRTPIDQGNKMINKPEKKAGSDALVNNKTHEMLFSELFRTYEYPLYTLAFRLSKDDAVAKDIIQEVFLALWTMRYKLYEIDNIEAYLFRITRFKVIAYFRKLSADDRLKEKIWKAMKDLDEDGTVKIEEREFHSILTLAIAQLPDKRKQVYLLKNTEGKTYKDIAKEMKISQHTVKNHLSSAARAIRKYFDITCKTTTLFIILFLY